MGVSIANFLWLGVEMEAYFWLDWIGLDLNCWQVSEGPDPFWNEELFFKVVCVRVCVGKRESNWPSGNRYQTCPIPRAYLRTSKILGYRFAYCLLLVYPLNNHLINSLGHCSELQLSDFLLEQARAFHLSAWTCWNRYVRDQFHWPLEDEIVEKN